MQVIAQENDIITKSVALDNLISFVVKNYDSEEQQLRQITFLIETNEDKLGIENEIILRQAFKIISERLHTNSKISIVTYKKFNGIALKPTSPKEIKLILHTITDLKANIPEFYNDGIDLAYNHADQNFMESANNSVVMVRIKNKSKGDVVNVSEEKKLKKKKKKKILLSVAIGLLPELLAVIKD
jgi:hypothetical protein